MSNEQKSTDEPTLRFEGGRWLDPSERLEYRVPIRTLWLSASELVVHTSQSDRGAKRVRVDGRCKIDAPFSTVSSMRETRRSSSFSLSIRADHPDTATSVSEIGDRRLWELAENENDYSAYLASVQKVRPTTAALGYLPRNDEDGTADDWFVEIEVSVEMLCELVESLRAGRLRKPYVGLKFANLYVFDFHAPLSEGVRWFLPPHRNRGDDIALGWVAALGWREDSVNGEATLTPAPSSEKSRKDLEEENEVPFSRLFRLMKRGYDLELTEPYTGALWLAHVSAAKHRSLILYSDGLLVSVSPTVENAIRIVREDQVKFEEFLATVPRPSTLSTRVRVPGWVAIAVGILAFGSVTTLLRKLFG